MFLKNPAQSKLNFELQKYGNAVTVWSRLKSFDIFFFQISSNLIKLLNYCMKVSNCLSLLRRNVRKSRNAQQIPLSDHSFNRIGTVHTLNGFILPIIMIKRLTLFHLASIPDSFVLGRKSCDCFNWSCWRCLHAWESHVPVHVSISAIYII